MKKEMIKRKFRKIKIKISHSIKIRQKKNSSHNNKLKNYFWKKMRRAMMKSQILIPYKLIRNLKMEKNTLAK